MSAILRFDPVCTNKLSASARNDLTKGTAHSLCAYLRAFRRTATGRPVFTLPQSPAGVTVTVTVIFRRSSPHQTQSAPITDTRQTTRVGLWGTQQLSKVYYTHKRSAEFSHISWGIGRRHSCTDPGHIAAHALRTRALPSFNLPRHSPRSCCQHAQRARNALPVQEQRRGRCHVRTPAG